ncbi:MAG: 2'-5' RNA ligase family protein [Patescibacteria group bacterium]
MSYYPEIWLRGLKPILSPEATETYHPHITLVRPFTPMVDEMIIQEEIVALCRGRSPIPFTLQGSGEFGDIQYVKVVNCLNLLHFNDLMEQRLEPYVEFTQKLDSEKIFHVTVQMTYQMEPFSKLDLFMLRLTCIRNKRIWFSYDFVTGEVLTRPESLDEQRWRETLNFLTTKSS